MSKLRPLRIEIENFLGIESCELDFKDGVFLIVGQNGAGKSSLLEAIVFSLYGVGVRYGKKSPFDYVRSGADHCQVKFSFLRGGKKYEVIRRVKAKDKSSEALLLINDRIVASQRTSVDEKLKEVMETSYESFISTFFLPQGMVANLLTATRSKINEVIFDVLFERKKLAKLIEKVNEVYKSSQYERDNWLRRINESKDELKKIEELLRQNPPEILQTEIEELERHITQTEEKLREVERELQIHQQVESLEKLLQSKVLEKSKLLVELEEEKKISTAKSLEISYREYLHACETLKRVENDFQRLQANRFKTHSEIQKLVEEIRKIQLELTRNDRELQAVQGEIEKLSKIDELSEPFVQKLSSLKERRVVIEQQLSKKRSEFEQVGEKLSRRKFEKAELETRLEDLTKQFDRIKLSAVLWMADQIAEQLQDGEVCPVCGNIYRKRSISGTIYDLENYKHMREQIEKIKEDGVKLAAEMETLTTIVEKLNQEIHSLNEELTQIKFQESDLHKKLDEMGYSAQLKKKLRELNTDLQKLLERRSKLMAELSEKESTKHQLSLRLQELDEELKNLSKEVEESLLRKQIIEKDFFLKLDKIGMDLETFKIYVAKEVPQVSVQERLSKIDAEIEQIQSQTEQLKKLVKSGREDCLKYLSALQKELLNFRKLRDDKLARKTLVQHYSERRKEIIQQLREMEEHFEELHNRSTVLALVKDTLAAREFQSYMADIVLNRVVERTNRLLDFLTDGRFSLLVEESGFIVNDAGVKRDASGLSGGEKTLVSIALAMSIAEEATGEMEAFFIDEGFSSLDSDNKSKIADALKKFERLNKVVGFVTHEPEFADYFERKLLVEKGGRLRWI